MESYSSTGHSQVCLRPGSGGQAERLTHAAQTRRSRVPLRHRLTCLKVFAFETALVPFLLRGRPCELRERERQRDGRTWCWDHNTVTEGVIFTLDSWGCIIFTTIFILRLGDPIITSFILLPTGWALTFRWSLASLISLRLRAKRISRAPMYSALSSLLRCRVVKLKTPLAEKLLVVLSLASEWEKKQKAQKKTKALPESESVIFFPPWLQWKWRGFHKAHYHHWKPS